MNKLIKWLSDLYYNNQRRPDEPEVTYQEPVTEPVEGKDPLEDYQIMYQDIYYSYLSRCILFVTTDYKVWKMDKSKEIKELDIGIPVISLMKYIDKMFSKGGVTTEQIDGIDYYQVGDYRFNNNIRNPLAEISKVIKMDTYELSILGQCVLGNITKYKKAIDKQARQDMEDKLQGLLKDLE